MTLTLARFNTICAALPATSKVVQWHGCHVWKVGDQRTGKVFAIGAPKGDQDDTPCPFTIKTRPDVFEFLIEQPGIAREVHLPRGHWLRIHEDADIDDDGLAQYIAASHAIIVASLSKPKRLALGLPV